MNCKKTSSNSDFLNSLQVVGLSEKEIRVLAYQTGFMKRAPKKIDALKFLVNICSISQLYLTSYNNLASRFYASFNTLASKQAFWKRVNDPCLRFFQAILERIIKFKCDAIELSAYYKNCKYKRVLVQDSTIIKLPKRLFKKYSGVKNAHATVCNARIQGVYDLLSGCFISFSIDPYSKNDQAAAPEIKLQEGDLVIRDRGYFINDEIKRHLEANADCIYRYKHKTKFINPVTDDTINLLEELEKNKKLDISVLLNNKSKTQIRLVAVPVKEEIANKRRMKAKKESSTKGKTSQEALKLMSWTIFITTIPAKKANFNELMTIYRLRWRIEIIFKIWKSHMNFDQVHNVSEIQLKVILLSRFIMIVICINFVFYPCYLKIRKKYGKYLSMIKVVNYLMLNQDMLYEILKMNKSKKVKDISLTLPLIKYCTYDTRKRLNYSQLFELILLS